MKKRQGLRKVNYVHTVRANVCDSEALDTGGEDD
jgi:hypothetical protein